MAQQRPYPIPTQDMIAAYGHPGHPALYNEELHRVIMKNYVDPVRIHLGPLQKYKGLAHQGQTTGYPLKNYISVYFPELKCFYALMPDQLELDLRSRPIVFHKQRKKKYAWELFQ